MEIRNEFPPLSEPEALLSRRPRRGRDRVGVKMEFFHTFGEGTGGGDGWDYFTASGEEGGFYGFSKDQSES
jgi:hypothetical protein